MVIIPLNYFPMTTFSAAKGKPIIAEPEIHGSQSLDNVSGFLLLMSEGLINALESAHGPEQANQVSLYSFNYNIYIYTVCKKLFFLKKPNLL